jgi:hypothetical protein
MEFYKTGHALNGEARKDRVQWLAERLKLSHIDPEAIGHVPDLGKEEKEEKD